MGSMKRERTETAMSMCFTASDPARAVQVVERLAHVTAAASGCLTGLAGAGLGGGGGVRVVGQIGLGEALGGGGDRVAGLAGDGGLAADEARDAAREVVLLEHLDGQDGGLDAGDGRGLGGGAGRELLREQRVVELLVGQECEGDVDGGDGAVLDGGVEAD